MTKQLKIGGHRFTVIRADLPDKQCGEIDRSNNTLTIDASLSNSSAESSLFHEVFHICNSELQHELLDSLAEQTYSWLSTNGLLNRRKLNALLALDKQD